MVFENFEKMRKGPAFRKGMCRYWPTPESVYETYGIPAGADKVCDADCSSRHCLPNICIQSYFTDRHFPLLRPLVYPTNSTEFDRTIDTT